MISFHHKIGLMLLSPEICAIRPLQLIQKAAKHFVFSAISPGSPTSLYCCAPMNLAAGIISHDIILHHIIKLSLPNKSTNRQVPTYLRALIYQMPHCTTFPLMAQHCSSIAQDTRKSCIKTLLCTGTKVLE